MPALAVMVAGMIVGCSDKTTNTASQGATSKVHAQSGQSSKQSASPAGGHVCRADARLCASFAVLRRPRRPGDLPGVDHGTVRENHLQLKLARRALKLDGKALYLIPGRATACLYFGRGQYGGFVCSPPKLVAVRGVQGGELTSGGVTITQFLPDGSHEVVLHVRGAKSRSLTMHGNAVAAHIPGPPRIGAISWLDRAGNKQMTAFDPGASG